MLSEGPNDGSPAERTRLLHRARHPGVAAHAEDDGREPGTGVTHARCDGPRLGATELTIEEIAGVFAVLATTVADLNDLGVQLGVVTGDGVHLGGDGRPVIVDLAAARIVDPPAGRGKTPNPDVRAVGALLTQTLRRCAPEVFTDPRATGHWPRRQARPLGQHVAALATTADRGAITLRQLADGLVHPDARLPRPLGAAVPSGRPVSSGGDGPDPAEPIGGPDPAEPIAGVDAVDGLEGVAAVTAGAGKAGGTWLAGIHRTGRSTDEHPTQGHLLSLPPDTRPPRDGRLHVRWRPVLGPPRVKQAVANRWLRRGAIGALAVAGGVLVTLGIAAIPAPSRPHARVAPARPGAPTGTSVCLARHASGTCTQPATYAGGVLSTPSGRYAVGRPDDVVAAGRWSCGRVATLATLRPDRGEVWAFPTGHPAAPWSPPASWLEWRKRARSRLERTAPATRSS